MIGVDSLVAQARRGLSLRGRRGGLQPVPTVTVAVTHQLLWDEAFSGNPPSIGDGPAGTAIPRIAAVPSGVFVGTLMGVVGGTIAHFIQRAASGRASAS